MIYQIGLSIFPKGHHCHPSHETTCCLRDGTLGCHNGTLGCHNPHSTQCVMAEFKQLSLENVAGKTAKGHPEASQEVIGFLLGKINTGPRGFKQQNYGKMWKKNWKYGEISESHENCKNIASSGLCWNQICQQNNSYFPCSLSPCSLRRLIQP